MKKKNQGQVVMVHITLGLQLAITIFIFVYFGHWLDKKYNMSPLFLACGTVLGMGIGFYHLMKELNKDMKKEEDGDNDDDQEKKRVKWNR